MDKVFNETRRETAHAPHIRSLAYNLFKNIRFSGEPVVPKIISEGKDEFGTYTEVEKLGGIDLSDFLELPDKGTNLKTKLSVMLHITRQLEAIDKEGFVIFDRNPGNTRILDWGDKISTRQMDLEGFYDKKNEALYGTQKSYIDIVDTFNEKELNLWFPSVNRLIYQSVTAAISAGNDQISKLLLETEWSPLEKKKGSSLHEHELLLSNIIKDL